jgi:hypothetical protein
MYAIMKPEITKNRSTNAVKPKAVDMASALICGS